MKKTFFIEVSLFVLNVALIPPDVTKYMDHMFILLPVLCDTHVQYCL